ncbi:MAG: hypothetical protein JNM84_14220 [Planctomycetes bacterium]|nr:hypothetical protein [Planctomycetota bacterium]
MPAPLVKPTRLKRIGVGIRFVQAPGPKPVPPKSTAKVKARALPRETPKVGLPIVGTAGVPKVPIVGMPETPVQPVPKVCASAPPEP